MPDDYYSETEVEEIEKARKAVQFMGHHPPETRARLLKAYKQAMHCIDQMLFLAECYAQQKQQDMFPADFDPAIQRAHAAMKQLDSNDPNLAAVAEAMELIEEFRQMKLHHISPSTLRSDICSSLKIKRT